jgi:hypothetical protein
MFKSSDYTIPITLIIVSIFIVCFIVACGWFFRKGIWDELINSGLMRGFFSEFD